MSWLEHDLDKRRNDASKLLSLVRLPLLSPVVNQFIFLFISINYKHIN